MSNQAKRRKRVSADPGKIRSVRRSLDVTQEEVAAAVGTSKTMISFIERRQHKPKDESLVPRIAAFLEEKLNA